MANTSILAAFERMWQHVVAVVGNKADVTHTHDVEDIDMSTFRVYAGGTVGEYATAEGDGTVASGIAAHAEGEGTTASGRCSHAEGSDTTANGQNSHAEGLYSEAVGTASHAEGELVYAFGYASHAEGRGSNLMPATITKDSTADEILAAWGEEDTTHFLLAKGNSSHAEGFNTLALGSQAHSEGAYTVASASASHAEGDFTVASGMGAHAEGGETTASGYYSHAEGEVTSAVGDGSHAEGYYTIANGDYSHVQGKFNVADDNNAYAHIVGNGESYNRRSNAHTVDWDGNGWFAGDVYVGGTDKNSGKVLVTKEYVDSLFASIEEIKNHLGI